MKSRLYIATLGAAALLGGCGGSDDIVATAPAPAPASTMIPDSAGASADALIAYMTALPVTETAEPLELGTFDPTASLSDTTEPIQLNPPT